MRVGEDINPELKSPPQKQPQNAIWTQSINFNGKKLKQARMESKKFISIWLELYSISTKKIKNL